MSSASSSAPAVSAAATAVSAVSASAGAAADHRAVVLVSGGDGSLSGRYEGDAAVSERFLQAFGVDPARLVKEDASRTTFRNEIAPDLSALHHDGKQLSLAVCTHVDADHIGGMLEFIASNGSPGARMARCLAARGPLPPVMHSAAAWRHSE